LCDSPMTFGCPCVPPYFLWSFFFFSGVSRAAGAGGQGDA